MSRQYKKPEPITEEGKAARFIRWTAEELGVLRQYYPDIETIRTYCPIRTEKAIQQHASRMGLVNGFTRWTSKEVQKLKKSYGKVSYQNLSRTLNKTELAIRLKAVRLGLTKGKNQADTTR